MAYVKEPAVDAYIDVLPEWQQEICQRVRDLVHAVDPEIEEAPKYRGRPYFVLQGNVCALMAAKDHVNVFLYDPLVDDPHGIITHGHDNATGRQIWMNEGDRIDTKALSAMIKQIVAHNRAGGWRRIQRSM